MMNFNKQHIALGIALAGLLSLSPMAANAGNVAWNVSVGGGYAGGYGGGYGYGYGRPAPVPVYRDACPPPAPRGYWTEVPVKVWVPAEWIVSRGHHGRDVRTLRPGYFTYRTDRVWVADAGRPGDFRAALESIRQLAPGGVIAEDAHRRDVDGLDAEGERVIHHLDLEALGAARGWVGCRVLSGEHRCGKAQAGKKQRSHGIGDRSE